MIRRGAPFDRNNFFNIPPVDAGEIVMIYDSRVAKIEGGNFQSIPESYFDGGFIPALGTASYDPNVTYGPDSPLIEDDD